MDSVLISKISKTIGDLLERIVRWLVGLDRRVKRVLVLLTDAVLCVIAVWIAFSLRLGLWLFAAPPVIYFAAAALLLFPPIFFATGTYRHIFRFAGSGTIVQLALACAITAAPLVLLFSLSPVAYVPRTIPAIHAMVFFGLLSMSRIIARYLLFDINQGSKAGNIKRVMIYGATAAGRQLSAALRGDPYFELLGIIDDDPRLDRQKLDVATIYHSANLSALIEKHSIDAIFIALTDSTRAERNAVVRRLQSHKIHVLILPTTRDIASGDITINDLREVRIEDLLGRDAVAPDPELLARTITGKTVLVTGAGGSIGSELCRQIIQLQPKRLVLAEISEAALFHIHEELTGITLVAPVPVVPELINLTDRSATERLFTRWRPQTVFHAAAYKHVPLVEANVISGLRNNIVGTRNGARAARLHGAERFVLVSTDKAVRPTSVMGASKRVCELVLQTMADGAGQTRFTMVRFGNVLGSSGSVVPHFRAQIARGGPVTLTHRDVTRFFMTIPEAAQLVIQAGAMAQGGEVFLLNMGQAVRIEDLARTMIELAGRSVRSPECPDGDIEIVEIGLRPGEKLYEELLIGNNDAPTSHPMIRRANEKGVEPLRLDRLIGELEHHLQDGDQNAALRILRELVPEYGKPQQLPSPPGAAAA